MQTLTQKIEDILSGIFAALDLPQSYAAVRVSDRPDLAQFQCNGAMAAARAAQSNPRDIAQKIAAQLLQHEDVFSKIEVAGPGFINLSVTDDFLTAHTMETRADSRAAIPVSGDGSTVILDYAGPNVAKAMHVGHLRPTIIGDALKRMVTFAGYRALGDVHMGDWGTPIGTIISELELRHPEWPYFDAAFTGPYPSEPPFAYNLLEEIYPLASQACKDDLARRELSRRATADLQSGRPGYRALWAHMMTLSKADMRRNFDMLNVTFELWKGEADVNDIIPELAAMLQQKNLLIEDQGATVIPVAREDDNKEMPPLMFFKTDGAVTYGTTDMATIHDRVNSHKNLSRILYVVDKRQALHFEQVFRATEKAGLAPGVAMKFIGFGTLNGLDNKPFKSRDGGVMKFASMIEQTIDKARQRLTDADLGKDLTAEEKEDIARKVAVAALKFADLSNQPHVDYIFDLDRMSSFEGKTGPYLLYQAVRIKSLLRKAQASGYDIGENLYVADADRPLILELAKMPQAVDTALRDYMPSHICNYLYELSQAFSSFYNNCHILSEPDEFVRGSRLALCEQTLKQLELGLGLLGIDVPERM